MSKITYTIPISHVDYMNVFLPYEIDRNADMPTSITRTDMENDLLDPIEGILRQARTPNAINNVVWIPLLMASWVIYVLDRNKLAIALLVDLIILLVALFVDYLINAWMLSKIRAIVKQFQAKHASTISNANVKAEIGNYCTCGLKISMNLETDGDAAEMTVKATKAVEEDLTDHV